MTKLRSLQHYLFSLGILALIAVLGSCGSNHGKREPSNKSKEAKKGQEQYLRLTISRPNEVVLRAATSDPLMQINRLYLLFYDQTNNLLKHIREVNMPRTKDRTNLNVRLIPGDYLMVGLANPTPEVVKLINVGAPLSNLTQGQNLRVRELQTTEGLSVMTNEQGAIAISRDSFVPKLQDGVSPTISLTLEPVLARVLVYGNPELTTGKRGIATPKYTISNIPKQTVLLRQLNLLSSGNMETPGDGSNRSERYAKSPHWDAWVSNPPSNTDDIGAYTVEQSTAEAMRGTIQANAEDAKNDVTNNTQLYVKESVVPDNAQFTGLMPFVLIAYPYIPSSLTLSGNEGWFSFRGVYYSESTIRTMIRTNSIIPEALKRAIQDNNITEDKITQSKQGFSLGGLNFYYQGYSYYSVFIKHFPNATPENPYGRYGIVRGNEYHINLKRITSVGSPTPITYIGKLETVTEEQVNHLSAGVAPLTKRVQDVSF